MTAPPNLQYESDVPPKPPSQREQLSVIFGRVGYTAVCCCLLIGVFGLIIEFAPLGLPLAMQDNLVGFAMISNTALGATGLLAGFIARFIGNRDGILIVILISITYVLVGALLVPRMRG